MNYLKLIINLFFLTLYSLFILVSISNAEETKNIKIAAGPIIGRYYLVATKICSMLEDSNNELECKVIPTHGSIENIDLLKNNKVDFAIAQSDISLEAFKGIEYYKGKLPFKDLRQVLNLYEENFNILSKKNTKLKTFDDINNKNISYGVKNSATYLTYQSIKELYPNIKPIEIEVKSEDYAKKLCKGEIEVLMITAGHPSTLINIIEKSCDIKFLIIEEDKINKLLEHNKGFKKTILKKGTYYGVDNDQLRIGVNAILLTNTFMDKRILSNFIEYFNKHTSNFKYSDQLLETLENNYFTKDFVLPKCDI